MFCSSCGIALSQNLKYCNRCGSTTEAVVKTSEKRLDNYLDGLFWVIFLGLGLILGGIALIHKLQIGTPFMVVYLALSSTAFLVNFWLNLREVLRITRSSKQPKVDSSFDQLSPSELGPMNPQGFLDAGHSVTEHTTRELESVSREKVRL